MCRGAKIFICRLSRCQEKDFRQKSAFFVFVFFRWRKKKRKDENMEKEEKPENLCFLGGCEQKMLAKNFISRKICNTISFRKAKNACFRWHSLFLDNGTFFVTIQITKHFAFCPSTNPFLEKMFFCSSVFFFVAFSCLCLLVSLKQTFLTSPFCNPSCFHLWLFLFFFCCFVLCSWCMFLPFCFYLGSIWGVYFICFYICFLFLVLLSDNEKYSFPCNSLYFSYVGYQVV